MEAGMIALKLYPQPNRSADPSTGSGCSMVSLSNHHDEAFHRNREKNYF
jgi:hypothetical protein